MTHVSEMDIKVFASKDVPPCQCGAKLQFRQVIYVQCSIHYYVCKECNIRYRFGYDRQCKAFRVKEKIYVPAGEQVELPW